MRFPEKALVHKPCLFQGREDQGDQHQLGQDARHGGKQCTGQKGLEGETASGEACQHEAHSTPHQTPRHHGGDESDIHHGQGVLHSAPDKAGHKAVGGQLKGHGDGDGKHRRHAEQHRAQQRSHKAHGQPPGAAQHKAAQQNGKMHGAQHVAHLRHMAGDHGQHKGQRKEQCCQHDAAGGRNSLGVHEKVLLCIKKGPAPGVPTGNRPLRGVF